MPCAANLFCGKKRIDKYCKNCSLYESKKKNWDGEDRREYYRGWYKENKDYFRHWREVNKKHYRNYQRNYHRNWRKENKEHFRSYQREYHRRNKK